MAEQDKQQAQEAQEIIIDTSGYNPAADPGNPAFTIATWQEAVEKAGGLDAMIAGLKARFAEPAERARQYMNLSIEQVMQLPKDERRICFDEAARQLVESPGFTAFMESMTTPNMGIIESISKAAESAEKAFTAILPAMTRAADNWKAIANLGTTLFDPTTKWDFFKAVIERSTGDDQQPQDLKAGLINGIFKDDTLENPSEIWDTLSPYIIAEYDTNPALYDDPTTPASILIAAAAQRARADGKIIPTLKAESEQAEQLVMDLNFPTQETAKEDNQQAPAKTKRGGAEADGALMTIGQRLLVPSDPEFQDAFVSRLNSQIGIMVIEKLTDIQLRNNGFELSLLENGITDIAEANKRTGARPLQDTDAGFLRAMAKGAYITRIRSDSITTSFYLPAFCDELGIQGGTRAKGADRAEARKREVLDRIEAFDNVWGKLPNSSQWWKVFSVIGYDPETEVVTVAMPYFNQLLTAIERKQQRQLEAGKKYYIGYCDLLHSSAANERNQAAVELATRVLIGVQQRGGLPDAKMAANRNKGNKGSDLCTWHISCAGLIADCPQMQEKLNAQKTTDGKNKLMQRAFTTMYKILKGKSDLFCYYKDVTITEVIPTSKTRQAEIVVTHHGLNPQYRRPAIFIDEQAE